MSDTVRLRGRRARVRADVAVAVASAPRETEYDPVGSRITMVRDDVGTINVGVNKSEDLVAVPTSLALCSRDRLLMVNVRAGVVFAGASASAAKVDDAPNQ